MADLAASTPVFRSPRMPAGVQGQRAAAWHSLGHASKSLQALQVVQKVEYDLLTILAVRRGGRRGGH